MGKSKSNFMESVVAITEGVSSVISANDSEWDALAFDILAQNLEESLFWNTLETAYQKAHISLSDFKIVIKPDTAYFDKGSPIGTNPVFVEHLIKLLQEKGYTNVNIVFGSDPFADWLDNRDALSLADLTGYSFETTAGNPYEILALTEGVNKQAFPKSSILSEDGLSDYWLNAHFRILFSKNKTDEAFYFSLGLRNLLGVLPLNAHFYHYNNRFQAKDVVAELLTYAPPHFSLIDGWVSNHGSQGSRAANPLKTNTFIASDNIGLTDWAGALKMGLDPYACSITAHILRTNGLPARYVLKGSLMPYIGWLNISKFQRESVIRRNASPMIAKLSSAWLQSVNTELFPFKNPLDGQINRLLAPLVAEPDKHILSHYALIALNYGLSNIQKWQEAWQIMFDKDRLYRQNVPLGFNPDDFNENEFNTIAQYIEPLSHITRHTTPDRNGLQWRYLDDSVVFQFERIVRVPFDIFIKKVDIARAVELMYDNIGGARQPLALDRNKRVIRQAERDIYLPQPNWMIFFGGEYIDVQKIETIEYFNDKQQIWWRTVGSPNKSAEYDDGLVAFEKHGDETLIRIVARQKFTLPLFWQVFDISYVPDVKNVLVSDAYVRFFSRTMANFEAVCEGRDPRIGRSFDPQYGSNTNSVLDFEIGQFKDIGSFLSGFLSKIGKNNPKIRAIATDENGYQHFQPDTENQQSDGLRIFVNDVANAVQKDLLLFIKPKN